MNRLSKERSAYLQHASHQEIDWYPWSEEAFDTAREQNKPIFLSSGAVWCHWCHVMAKECFHDKEIIKLLNEKFICIKLDRDERPDIDKRYQTAISLMGYGGGWPLTVFMTFDMKPFFGGTYFPPDDKWGKPGFKRVLRKVADFYENEREKIEQFSNNLLNALTTPAMISTEISEGLLDDAMKTMSLYFDSQNGGFGSAPKFPMPGAMEFILNRYLFTDDQSIGDFLKNTFFNMAKGGFHDHLLGGFHRYSVDEAWIIPHFEKMADDNSWLLRNYVRAYEIFKEPYFREVSEGIIRFFMETLSSKEGGFYASQDADVTPDDEGGYFTWTEEDLIRILSQEEFNILTMYFFDEKGSMHHDNSKKVIFEAKNINDIAQKTNIDATKVKEIIQKGKRKMLIERNKRQAPFIDKSIYTSLNGMAITSFIIAYRSFSEKYLKDFALKSLNMIINNNFVNGELFHSEGIKAMLDDYIYLCEACIAAYEITGLDHYKNMAIQIMDVCIDKLWDKKEGGFFDTENELLGIKLKLIEDTPHPSANSIAISLLLKLSFLTDKPFYAELAEKSLEVFYSRVKEIGSHAGSYFNAMDGYFNPLKLNLWLNPESEFANKALSLSYPHISFNYRKDDGYIIPCFKTTCYEPINSPDELKRFLENIVK